MRNTNDIPELKKHYTSSIYTFSNWGIALQDFLGIGLEVWAWENPTIWGNPRGISVYSFNEVISILIHCLSIAHSFLLLVLNSQSICRVLYAEVTLLHHIRRYGKF
jgi:hypothetical protein